MTNYSFTWIFLANILETFYIHHRTFRCSFIFITVMKTTIIINFFKNYVMKTVNVKYLMLLL